MRHWANVMAVDSLTELCGSSAWHFLENTRHDVTCPGLFASGSPVEILRGVILDATILAGTFSSQ